MAAGHVELPDLIVDAKATQNSWLVRVEDLPADFCSVEEGNITPGEHTLLRFTVTTPNIGNADVFIGSPLKHMDPNRDGTSPTPSDSSFSPFPAHFLFLYSNTACRADGRVVAAARGFCMLDTDPYNVPTATARGPIAIAAPRRATDFRASARAGRIRMSSCSAASTSSSTAATGSPSFREGDAQRMTHNGLQTTQNGNGK